MLPQHRLGLLVRCRLLAPRLVPVLRLSLQKRLNPARPLHHRLVLLPRLRLAPRPQPPLRIRNLRQPQRNQTAQLRPLLGRKRQACSSKRSLPSKAAKPVRLQLPQSPNQMVALSSRQPLKQVLLPNHNLLFHCRQLAPIDLTLVHRLSDRILWHQLSNP